MKTIKSLAIAMMALLMAASCSDINPGNNYAVYQDAVNKTVKKEKKSDKVILLVAFGSTWQQAFDAFDETVAAYKSKFSGYDVFLSYSSAICINRAAAGENAADGAEVRNYYAPPFWLNAFAQKGVQYKEIVVQSLQVIPGEEYTRVINYIKDFANNANGDISDEYLSKVVLKLGVPLLQDEEKDVKDVAKALNDLYKNQASKDVVAFMGHGNPDSYDTYKANVRYTQLEEALQALSPNYFVGTVDMMENFKTHVYERMVAAGLNTGSKKVYLHPLMSIDGDHGHNDMAGDDLPEKFEGKSYTIADLLAEANDEGEVEDCSWKVFFGAKGSGFVCDNSTMIEKGLLELTSIRQIWINHTQDAINGEPLDYYHSKNPE
ncbi:MAG: sirohydrochlorin cobaltochelatase [Bacteroidales bacterium]|nr:sirohydrochlorin cobaltochelatase [Bacteroidales bacterium]